MKLLIKKLASYAIDYVLVAGLGGLYAFCASVFYLEPATQNKAILMLVCALITVVLLTCYVPTKNNGDVVIFAGARFSTSDYGDGAVDMRAFLLNGACLNGMVRESVMRQMHLGAKLPDSLALSQQTYELDTQTTVSAVRDLTRGLFLPENIKEKAYEIQGASEIEVDLEKEVKKLTSNGSLLKAEGQEVEKLLMKNDPNDGVQGGSTLWKLTQAITAHARTLTPERSRELHEISGALLSRVKLNA